MHILMATEQYTNHLNDTVTFVYLYQTGTLAEPVYIVDVTTKDFAVETGQQVVHHPTADRCGGLDDLLAGNFVRTSPSAKVEEARDKGLPIPHHWSLSGLQCGGLSSPLDIHEYGPWVDLQRLTPTNAGAPASLQATTGAHELKVSLPMTEIVESLRSARSRGVRPSARGANLRGEIGRAHV